MPRRLDRRLKEVARLRRRCIKTVRDWRDSDSPKWHAALKELWEAEEERRKDLDLIRRHTPIECHASVISSDRG